MSSADAGPTTSTDERDPVPPVADPSGRPVATGARRGRWQGLLALTEARWAGAALLLLLLAAPLEFAGAPWWLWGPLYAGCYLSGGWESTLSGLRALRSGTLDVDLLMVVAAAGAAAIGQVFDGALLIVIFATSGALEAWATARTEDSVRGLLDASPDQVTRLTDGSGRAGEQVVAAADLDVGDVILIRPGELVGADGIVLDGTSELDQASITGEPLPVTKAGGDEVFAGTLNRAGALRVQVSRRAEESVLARIAALVEQAAMTKARTQLFIEKVEQRYSVGVVVATLAVFTIPIALGEALADALLRAMTFMIVASPCAVVLATMPPLLAAVANAGRRGILVKSARVIEQLATADVVAFDKTGTLTRGTPDVEAVRLLPAAAAAGWTESRALAAAAGAEYPSEHPLARAVVAAARHRGLTIPAAGQFTAHPGSGVDAVVDGRHVTVARPGHRGGSSDADTANAVDAVEADGSTAVLVSVDATPIAVLAITDALRPGAAQAVADLTGITGVRPVLLTGDNPRTAAHVAAEVGIDDVRAELLPEDKVTAIGALRDDHRDPSTGTAGRRGVVAVGDGVNDAPALAAADVGIAMGRTGADLTLHAADAVVVRDELHAIPELLDLARRARRVVTANLVIAGSLIAVLVTWDLVGHLPLPLGVAGHEGSTILVALNGLRLLRTPRARPGHSTG